MILLLLFFFSTVFAEDSAPFKKLKEGNARYVEDKLLHPGRDTMRREAKVCGQRPFATILSCADSRVPPEILFDQGVGDLFVVRVAGNVLGDTIFDSLEYAAVHLGSKFLVVLGHQNCGAVSAVLQKQTKDIPAVAKQIEPAITDLSYTPSSPDSCENPSVDVASKANVKRVVQELKKNPLLHDVEIVGGFYEIGTGKVEWLE